MTSNETYNYIAEKVKSVPLKDVQEYISKKFYNVEEIVEFLYLVFTSKGNGILYGPGGFGKSQVTKEFLNFYNINSAVKVGHSSMDVESLLGIPNIEKLTKESIYEIEFSKSIFSLEGVLILEEFLDVNPNVAASLKDILTEGGYRQGDKLYPSSVGPVIICSNKSPEEVSTDLSTSAFYKERFPYSLYTIWNSFTYENYLNLYSTLYGDQVKSDEKYQLLADICSISCKDDNLISPRIAIKARDAFLSSNELSSLRYISSLDYSKIEEVRYRIKEVNLLKNLADKIDEFKILINSFSYTNIEEALCGIKIVNKIVSELQSADLIGDQLLEKVSSFISLANEYKDSLVKKIINDSDVKVLPDMNKLSNEILQYIK
jgi:hypothetical protein